MNSKSKKNNFIWIRILAICAFFCTVTLALALWGESLVPGDKSQEQSNGVGGVIKEVFQIREDVLPQSLKIAPLSFAKHFFNGSTVTLNVTLSPHNANRNFVYSTDDEQCIVNADGVVTYCGTQTKYVTITVASALNEDVKDSVLLKVYGVNPFDTRIDRLQATLLDDDQTATNTAVVGKNYQARVFAYVKEQFASQFGLQDASQPLPISDEILSATCNDDLAVTNGKGRVVFVKEGDASIDVNLLDENATPTLQTYGISVTAKKTETQYLPTLPLLLTSTDGAVVASPDGSFTLTLNATQQVVNFDVTLNDVDQGKNGAYAIECATDKAIVSQNTIARLCGEGTFDLTIRSLLNADLVTVVHVNMQANTPTKLTIGKRTKLAVGNSHTLNAFFNKKTYDGDDVVWSVVYGNNVAEVNAQTGLITAKRIGVVKVRAQSTHFANLRDDITIFVTPWGENFALFVRKFIGHFLAFAVLGVGMAFCGFMLLKPRWLCCISAPLGVFVSACISEMLQMPVFTQGRGASWTDVAIDTAGGLVGIAFSALAIALFCLLYKRHNNQGYQAFKQYFNKLSFFTVFTKWAPPDTQYEEEIV